jgi:hypothetical protein
MVQVRFVSTISLVDLHNNGIEVIQAYEVGGWDGQAGKRTGGAEPPVCPSFSPIRLASLGIGGSIEPAVLCSEWWTAAASERAACTCMHAGQCDFLPEAAIRLERAQFWTLS